MASGSARQRPTRSRPEAVRDVDGGERGQHPRAAGGRDRVGRWRRGGVAGSPDRWSIASRQTSLIRRDQLLALGVGRDMIDRALGAVVCTADTGHLLNGAVAALPPLALELAAVLACGDAALLSHHSAAATWGIRPSFNGDVHVTVVGNDSGRRRQGIRVHRVSELTPRHPALPEDPDHLAGACAAGDRSGPHRPSARTRAGRGADQTPGHRTPRSTPCSPPTRNRRGAGRLRSGRPRPPDHRDALGRRRGAARRHRARRTSTPPK